MAESLGPRDLESVTAFAEFLKARRAARSFAYHAEAAQEAGPESAAPDSGLVAGEPTPASAAGASVLESEPGV